MGRSDGDFGKESLLFLLTDYGLAGIIFGFDCFGCVVMLVKGFYGIHGMGGIRAKFCATKPNLTIPAITALLHR